MPVKALSRKFRGKFLYYLRREALAFFTSVAHLNDPNTYAAFLDSLYKKEWVVYCKKPLGSAEKAFDYIGRYTHRVAISNNRILGLNDGQASFRWRDYKDGGKNKMITLPADELIRRFLMHMLPSGFCKIRHFGLLAPRDKTQRISLCCRLTRTKFALPTISSAIDKLASILGKDWNLCPRCGVGHRRDPPISKIA